MKSSIKKTKVLSIGCEQARILLDGSVLENVTEFTYLGSIMSQDGGCIAEIDAEIEAKQVKFLVPGRKGFLPTDRFQSPQR